VRVGLVRVRLRLGAIRDGHAVCCAPSRVRLSHERGTTCAEASERDAQVPCETGGVAAGGVVETIGGTPEMALRRVNWHRVDGIYEGIREREREEGGVEREMHSLDEKDSRVKGERGDR
jgi:hypothetical protein